MYKALLTLATLPRAAVTSLAGWQQRLQRLDRALLDAIPAAGRYGWETVLVLAC
jgi:hypothetical protein